jgi:general secretion pathway protein L
MSAQLVLSLPVSTREKFRWCWRDAHGNTQETSMGDQSALEAEIASQGYSSIETWLILPGEKLVTRELDYNEKEKKHLRNLLPFQLEEALIGDVEDIHLAIANPRDGKISIAYTDKNWLGEQIEKLNAMGLDVVRCSMMPLVWTQKTDSKEWLIAEYDKQLHVQYGPDLGFSLPLAQAPLALQLLAADNKPDAIHLRAANEDQIDELEKLIPAELEDLPRNKEVKDWCSNLSLESVDLCQGDFSRRLPVERWWKLWQNLAVFAGICLAVTIVSLMIQIRQLNKESLQLRVAMENAARTVIPQGKLTSVEKQVANLLSQLQPTQQSAGLMELLAMSLPVVSQSPDVKIKALNYSHETGELAISVQANDFAAFERMTNALKEQGMQAEILNVNAQGDTQSARLRIHK